MCRYQRLAWSPLLLAFLVTLASLSSPLSLRTAVAGDADVPSGTTRVYRYSAQAFQSDQHKSSVPSSTTLSTQPPISEETRFERRPFTPTWRTLLRAYMLLTVRR